MIDNILFTLWFFLPAGLANMAPIFAAKTPWLDKFSTPLDFGKVWRGYKIFGDHKTWRGLLSGVFVGFVVIALQKYAYENYAWANQIAGGLDYSNLSLWLGGLMGFGALAGDAIKSFFKRQFKRQAGASWFPFDQLDYIIGGILASLFFIRLEASQYIWILIIWFVLHLIGSYTGYLLKLKAKPI